MKKKVLSIIALLLTVAVTGAWAEDLSESFSTVNGATYTGSHFKVNFTDGSGDEDGMFIDEDVVIIEALNGEIITKAEFTKGWYNINDFRCDVGTTTINGDVAMVSNVNASSLTAYASSSLQIRQIKVYYTAPPTYKTSLAEGTEDADKWTIDPAEAEEGATVTVSYSGTRKVKSVTATKKAAASPVLSGKFSVASGTQVQFSRGNLQATYDGSSWAWAFAEHQYDYVGNAEGNTKVSASTPFVSEYTGSSTTVDLFGWVGASSTVLTTSPAMYGIYNSTTLSDYGNSSTDALNDWGNTIDGSTWFTLSNDQWSYLFSTRTNASSLYGHGKIGDVNGMIILPDDWTLPSGLSFTAGNSKWVNSYSTDDWSKMESAGAVFLPAAGYRGNAVLDAGAWGMYWSSTAKGTVTVYYMGFYSDVQSYSDVQNPAYSQRYFGYSVRLVCTAQ